jgi:hypothetical protein
MEAEQGKPDPVSSTAVHLAVSILAPAAYCVTAAALGDCASPDRLPLTVFGALAPVLAAAFSASSSLVFERERVSAWGFLRSFVLFIVALWPLQALLLGRPGGVDFRPDPAGIFLMADCCAAYAVAAKLRGSLRSRELFMESVRGLEGERLRSSAREDGALSLLAFRETGQAASLSTSVLLALLGASCVLSVIGRPFSPFLLSALSASTISGFMVRAVVADFRETHSLLCMGIVPGTRERASRLRLALAVAAILCLASPFLAGDSPILPLSRIARAWNSFLSLFPARARALTPLPAPTPLALEPPSGPAPSLPMPEVKPLIDLSAFLAVFGRVLLGGMALAFAIFLLAPLFSRSLGQFLKARRPVRALGSILSFFKRLLRLLFGKASPVPGMRPEELKRIERRFESLGARKANPAKERETGRMAKAFLRLIERGAELGHPYLDSSVPVEWARSAAAAWPPIAAGTDGARERRIGEELVAAAELFEAALYSEKLLGKKATEEYFEIVGRVLPR